MTSCPRLSALLVSAVLSTLAPQATAASVTPRKTAAAPEETVSLNFSNAEIESVIRAIGKISGRNFLVDPRVKGTLNIVTNTPVARSMTYDILLSALRLQGYAAVEGSGVTKIVPEADAKLHAVPSSQTGEPAANGEKLVTRVFNLQYESAAQMVAVVRPLVAPNNTVTAFPANNTLVVTDYADNIARIGRIIDSIDVPQGGVMVLELQHAAASDLAETLTKLMGQSSGNTPQGQANQDASQWVQIVPDTRTNALLVRADSPSKLATVRRLVSELDRPGAGGNIHVVYLKNADAVQVAKTLNAVINGESAASSSSSHSRGVSGSTTGNKAASSTSSQSSSSAGLGSSSSDRFNQSESDTVTSGIVQADASNNALIITAPEAIYNNLRHVIDQLDRRRVQIYVEALIAEISSERAAEVGIQWNGSNGGTNFGGVGQNILSAMLDPSSVGKGLNLLLGSGTISVPVNGTTVEVANLSMLARFLESDTRANILSTPNLITLDNQEAKIVVGKNLPFVTGQYTSTGSTSTVSNPFQTIERQDVGLTLHIKPQITEGGTVRLDIYQEASSVVEGVDDSLGPTTNKRSIDTSVLVDDGAIIALGGLVEDSYSGGEEKVPLLGDIPIAGALFRYDTRKRTKTNLVVFLRPMILRDKESYQSITNSRYDYVIGQQRSTAAPRDLMHNERTPPELPAFGSPMPSVPQSYVPVEDAEIIYLRRGLDNP